MDKKTYQKILDDLGFPKEEYYILGSGSLLFYGLRETAHDMDLCISEELFHFLQYTHLLDTTKKNECGFIELMPNVEVVVNKKEDFERDFVDGYPVEKLEKILAFKEHRNLSKDQKDIQKIKQYLCNTPDTI